VTKLKDKPFALLGVHVGGAKAAGHLGSRCTRSPVRDTLGADFFGYYAEATMSRAAYALSPHTMSGYGVGERPASDHRAPLAKFCRIIYGVTTHRILTDCSLFAMVRVVEYPRENS
jgi:hypothetical protein